MNMIVHVYVYKYDCFIYVHMFLYCIYIYFMAVYSAVRVSLMSRCVI